MVDIVKKFCDVNPDSGSKEKSNNTSYVEICQTIKVTERAKNILRHTYEYIHTLEKKPSFDSWVKIQTQLATCKLSRISTSLFLKFLGSKNGLVVTKSIKHFQLK